MKFRILVPLLALHACCFADIGISTVPLPAVPENDVTLLEAIDQRRSTRSFSDESITLEELAGILHSAQGITGEYGFRAAPSAGATFPLTIYAVIENVESVDPGIYRFYPEENTITVVITGNYLGDLSSSALGQRCISCAPAAIVISADYSVTTSVYGDRGVMYVHMEAGHVSQNIYLQCTALGLGTVAVGAFENDEVSDLLELTENETPLYIMPLGRP